MEFVELRPRLLLLLELHRNAGAEEARANLITLFEEVFLACAWNVATDLLENGWEPSKRGGAPTPAAPPRAQTHLRLVGR
jgi:hypothetical protein